MSEQFGDETVVLADTNLFVAVGSPGSEKYTALCERTRRHDVVLLVPHRVRLELSSMRSADRIDTAVEGGWAELVDPPEPTASDAISAMDVVRRYIADRTGQDEHEVEKADTVFAGLAIQYLRERADTVVVLTDDKHASAGIDRAVEIQGYEDGITVLRRADIVDPDDDIGVI